MNAPPFGGQLIVMPYLGLYNTTTFIMRCVDFLDEKPKINVDADSIVVNDNLISDDEFFDDFFDE